MGSAVQPAIENSLRHDWRDLARLFGGTLGREYNTALVGGASEPDYIPGETPTAPAQIRFTQDFFASALHELAHWCIAGAARRRLRDYGYWYVPDGRTAQQQALFEQVEVKPQALEWIFSAAARFPFRLSADNLDQGLGPSAAFAEAVAAQARQYLAQGLPRRAGVLAQQLGSFYGGSLAPDQFDAAVLPGFRGHS